MGDYLDFSQVTLRTEVESGLRDYLQLIQVVWGFLVYIIIEPVTKEEVGVAAPFNHRVSGWVIIWEIIFGERDRKPLFDIPFVLGF